MKEQLRGVRVIDCSIYASATLTSRILADWGAEVIHVESPGGDPGRRGRMDAEAYDFEFYNMNKKGIVLNMKDPEGAAVMNRLLEDADVFVTNYRSKALKKLGLDYETFHARHPRVVWAQITGFGEEGPEADAPGFDVVAYWARTGQIVDFVEPGSPALNAPIGYGDAITGSVLAGGICAALYNQARTGLGEKVTTSLYGTAAYAMYYVIASSYAGAHYPVSRRKPEAIPLKNSFCCADSEWIYICILDHSRDYPRLCRMLGREDLEKDPRFCELAAAQENCQALTEILDREFLKKSHEEWMRLLSEYDLPYSALPHTADIHKDPQCQANRFIETYTTRKGEVHLLPNTPVRFGDNLPARHEHAPLFGGQDTRALLQEAGYSDEQIDRLAKQGSIGVRTSGKEDA